jgi:DNA polymerase-3 subunit delta'
LDQIRDISRFLSRQPLESSRGLVVLEEPEAMAEAAANALLKTLEEPGHGVLILLTAAPERLLSTIRSRCQLIRLIQLSPEDMQSVLQGLPAEVDQEAVKQALTQPELVAMAGGSPGALLDHVKQWSRVSPELMERLNALPTQPIEALGLARDLTEALDGEQQLWLINWLQQHLWREQKNGDVLKKLERLRVQLLSFVQPRLAWEVTLLNLMGIDR